MPGTLTKLYRIACAFALHTCASMMALVGIWMVQRLYRVLYGGDTELLFGRVPLAYMFQMMDVSVLVVLVWKSCRELWDAFSGDD